VEGFEDKIFNKLDQKFLSNLEQFRVNMYEDRFTQNSMEKLANVCSKLTVLKILTRMNSDLYFRITSNNKLLTVLVLSNTADFCSKCWDSLIENCPYLKCLEMNGIKKENLS
jgi:hypothetical protein